MPSNRKTYFPFWSHNNLLSTVRDEVCNGLNGLYDVQALEFDDSVDVSMSFSS